MPESTKHTTHLYKVVIDSHGHYVMRPATEPLPLGWREGGIEGGEADCLIFIREAEAGAARTMPPAPPEEPPLSP